MSKLESNKKKKKNALYTTAFDLFTTKGIAKTTISDIVESAGVAKGTFYLYFKDKYDIRNKLISHKTGELFYDAHEALLQAHLTDFNDQIHFIVDYILTQLEKDHNLLVFISKNLAWGIFKGAFAEKVTTETDEDYHFYQSFLDLLALSGRTFRSPELVLFTIIELVGSTCYSCILYSQPVTLEEYKPYLHDSIDALLNTFSEKGDVCP